MFYAVFYRKSGIYLYMIDFYRITNENMRAIGRYGFTIGKMG